MKKKTEIDMYHRWLVVFDKVIDYLEEQQDEVNNPSDRKYSHRMEILQRKLKIPQIVFVLLRALFKGGKNKEALSHWKTWRKDLMDDYDQEYSITSSENAAVQESFDISRYYDIREGIKNSKFKINLEDSNDLSAYRFMLDKYHKRYIGEESELLFSDSFFINPALHGENNTVYYYSDYWKGTVCYNHDQVYSINKSILDKLIQQEKDNIFRKENMTDVLDIVLGHRTVCIHNEELFGMVSES